MPKIVFDQSDPIGDFLSAARQASQADLRSRIMQSQVDEQTYRDGQFDKRQGAIMDRQLAVENQRSANAQNRARQQSIWQQMQRQQMANQQVDALTKHFSSRGELTPEIADLLAYTRQTGDLSGLRKMLDPEEKAKQARQQEQEQADLDARAATLEMMGASKDQIGRVVKSKTAFDNFERAFREQKAAKEKTEQRDAAIKAEDKNAVDRMIRLSQTLDGTVPADSANADAESIMRQHFERTRLIGGGFSPGQYEPLPSERPVMDRTETDLRLRQEEERRRLTAIASLIRSRLRRMEENDLQFDNPDYENGVNELIKIEQALLNINGPSAMSSPASIPLARDTRQVSLPSGKTVTVPFATLQDIARKTGNDRAAFYREVERLSVGP
ncbi:MAG: hypothetical protein LW822_11065 [Phycisphaeraceae bacterium]|jgi:hypothetical protein|nr:hypothetical protein [Phycisphaeraceae bacterium]